LQTNIRDILTRMSQSSHRGHTFETDVLLALAEVLPEGPITSLETGCGKSTVLFSNISRRHLVFAYDDRGMPQSSVDMVHASEDFNASTTEFIYGPTQKTLPFYQFGKGEVFDVILLDGPHGYPFPDLEYAILYERLKVGSVLVIDDIHIPSIGHMYDLLRVDRMYDEVGVFASTGVLRRTELTGVPSDGDHWWEQNYNASQFPRSMEKYHPDRNMPLNHVVDFTSPEVVARYARRGVELAPDGLSAHTIDAGATFEFALPTDGSRQTEVEITYQSIYEDAASEARVIAGSESYPLSYHRDFQTKRFVFAKPATGRFLLTLLHENARPEHNRQKQYDFRRLGTRIRSIAFHVRRDAGAHGPSPAEVSSVAEGPNTSSDDKRGILRSLRRSLKI
jgi:hypothetical protein